jgi:hypothetical protein
MSSPGLLDWPTRDDDGTVTARPKADRVGGRLDDFRRGGVAACFLGQRAHLTKWHADPPIPPLTAVKETAACLSDRQVAGWGRGTGSDRVGVQPCRGA